MGREEVLNESRHDAAVRHDLYRPDLACDCYLYVVDLFEFRTGAVLLRLLVGEKLGTRPRIESPMTQPLTYADCLGKSR